MQAICSERSTSSACCHLCGKLILQNVSDNANFAVVRRYRAGESSIIAELLNKRGVFLLNFNAEDERLRSGGGQAPSRVHCRQRDRSQNVNILYWLDGIPTLAPCKSGFYIWAVVFFESDSRLSVVCRKHRFSSFFQVTISPITMRFTKDSRGCFESCGLCAW